MGRFLFALRRSFWVLALGAAGTAGYSWWRQRTTAESLRPPEWPPLPATASSKVLASVTDIASVADIGSWVAPDADGSCPLDHPIKANDNSGIFHVPGGRFYDRTKAERCYQSAEAAAADGYRQAKN